MKKYSLIIALLFCLFSFAQEKRYVSIEWVDNSYYNFNEAYKYKVPFFKSENFSYNDVSRLICFSEKFKVVNNVDDNSLIVSNISYENISVEALGELDKNDIKSDINAKISNAQARDEYYAVFSFLPIIKQNGVYKRVKSLEYTYRYSPTTGISSKNIMALSSSVLKTGEWKRFYVQKSGVYKITKSFLSSLGFNVNVDPRTIKIYGNGGRMIPLINSVSYPFDIAENAIHITSCILLF